MARSIIRAALTTLAAAALAACGGARESATLPGSALLEITPGQSSYAAGTNVGLTVRNLGSQAVDYSMCKREFQRLSASAGWATVYVEIPPCLQAASIHTLAPGETITGAVTLRDDLQAGTYRIYFPGFQLPATSASSADLQTQKSSKPFAVTR